MLFIQLTGLPDAGKTTIAKNTQSELQKMGYKAEVLDADVYRKVISRDLGFSKADRNENIRRLAFFGLVLVRNEIITIMSAINPYDDIRQELKAQSNLTHTVWIKCDLDTLISRDTKGLYKRAMLPESHPDKLHNLTGVNDIFEIPKAADLIIETNRLNISECTKMLTDYIIASLNL